MTAKSGLELQPRLQVMVRKVGIVLPDNVYPTDEDGVEHVVVDFQIRGPNGAGKVYAEKFRDKVDKQWKFMYLIGEVTSPSPPQLVFESCVPE